jgi:XTP/dITP diphosphohydrolase
MQIVACTSNRHKIDELTSLLAPADIAGIDSSIELPPETGTTFEANATIKAKGGAAHYPEAWVVADDSGLEVDALNGEPGVWSARFAGEGASDSDNVELLLDRLIDTAGPDRTARFVCVLVAVGPDGEVRVARGVVEGTIALAPKGDRGFGYDPVFIPEGETQTYAQLGSDVKAQTSHRARAAMQLASMLGVGVA